MRVSGKLATRGGPAWNTSRVAPGDAEAMTRGGWRDACCGPRCTAAHAQDLWQSQMCPGMGEEVRLVFKPIFASPSLLLAILATGA